MSWNQGSRFRLGKGHLAGFQEHRQAAALAQLLVFAPTARAAAIKDAGGSEWRYLLWPDPSWPQLDRAPSS